MRKLKVKSLESVVNTKIILYFVVFSLFSFYFSLSTCFADEIRSRSVVVMDASTEKIQIGRAHV